MHPHRIAAWYRDCEAGRQALRDHDLPHRGSYSDGRHPDSVAFVPDVREDLARRDFTINAMAYSAEEGLCDPFGGQEDLARAWCGPSVSRCAA